MNDGLHFLCHITDLPEKTFAVAEFSLQEELSELFTLSLTLVSKRADIDLESLLLQSVKFRVVFNDIEQRQVSGIISQAIRGDTHAHRTIYHLTVQPALWRMNLNQDSRVYHRQSVPEILKSLLKKHGILFDCQLDEFHYTREYVTQKRESDYAFFARLVAEEGLNFWFEDDKLFFSDSHLGMTANLPLVYNPQIETATEMNVVNQVRLGVSMTPNRVIYKDYNPQNPAYRLTHRANIDPRVEGQKTLFELFESYGRFQKDAQAKPFVQRRQQAVENQRQAGCGQSNCFKLMPGKIFELNEHPVDAMNTRWQIVTIHHHGKCPQALQEQSGESGTYLHNEFSFISGYRDWRALYRYKPLADGDEVATVVGPEGEEIYVNEEGCIRIHFHWDRYDKADENATCWVRFAQGWNGSGYGFMAVPRIGQEVIVSYLNGDIDRPIVTGCTYNGSNRPPLNLPAEKTRTTFKTQTHKGEGFNELRFEDEKDREEIYLRGQKDLTAHIQHDAYWHIKHDHKQRIDNNRYSEISVDDHQHVKGSGKYSTDGDVSHRISGSQHLQTGEALVAESGQETHLKSGGKMVLEAASEITLKVGGHFIRLTPGGILTSPNLLVGQGSAGTGRGLSLQLPESVEPLPDVKSPVKRICALQAQREVNLTINNQEDE
ncbi:type VI secretion system Vgr family protein [Photorhabdus hindustanensis]|uniref:Type VI secretion system tip protein VgrG n=1 Tax=Photorhabdus hindustanensis TaxID=2918802 RepID=A0A2S8Q2N8_9GAMM|nr:type VI secretion system tip protein TssI/VgrG [Photorhabdus hindustanensis]PQQ26314.1 type VI secretion system tip protein VgrG [Photorhabdus hindustanensis]